MAGWRGWGGARDSRGETNHYLKSSIELDMNELKAKIILHLMLGECGICTHFFFQRHRVKSRPGCAASLGQLLEGVLVLC